MSHRVGVALQRYKTIWGKRGNGRAFREFDFTAMSALPTGFAYTCAAAQWYFNSAGVFTQAAIDEVVFDYNPETLAARGIYLPNAITNLAVRSRDLTNASWVKTNGSAAKDQTGLDNVASSASRFTASAANGTCLQTYTGASSARTFSVFLKRLVGSGNIQITANNGTTWTTVAVTTSWKRFNITASMLNPVFGIRVVTNTDSVAFDLAQFQDGTRYTNPIPTTAAAVATANGQIIVADLATILYNSVQGMFSVDVEKSALGLYTDFLMCDDNTTTNFMNMFSFTNDDAEGYGVLSSVDQFNGYTAGGHFTNGQVRQLALSYLPNRFLSLTGGANMATGSPDVSGTVPVTLSRLRFGTNASAAARAGFWLRRFAYQPVSSPL